jgi:hypothetical protein
MTKAIFADVSGSYTLRDNSVRELSVYGMDKERLGRIALPGSQFRVSTRIYFNRHSAYLPKRRKKKSLDVLKKTDQTVEGRGRDSKDVIEIRLVRDEKMKRTINY